ncbi:MAG: 4-alpha-glucanotransferase [Bacillota bacterium]|nr:4-alpha-glucanotransferase [Bacillota bacterium]
MAINTKKAGLLCPVFSVPGNQGIGDFGKKTERMIDIIRENGYSIWQILPIQFTGDTNSPYQTLSSFAGDPIYINLDKLAEMGLLKQSSIKNCNKFSNYVNYQEVRQFKEEYFVRAFKVFKKEFKSFSEDFEIFKSNAFWLEDWSLFYLFRTLHNGLPWNEWDEEYREYTKDKEALDLSEYEDELFYFQFLQFIFYKQLDDIVLYAHSVGLEIMGDVPFYVNHDSADVWTHRQDFLLDEDGNAKFVAGCPPDYFNSEGQRWGMPIYNFKAQRQDGFTFWCKRIQWIRRYFDVIRIDHFRAMDTYWKIPVTSFTAKDGIWTIAPGKELLQKIIETNPGVKLVADDLGMIRKEVKELEEQFGIPGMIVLLFHLETKTLKTEIPESNVLYTGTHDNQTANQVYSELDNNKKTTLRRFFKKLYNERDFSSLLCRYALDSNARLVILPIWDICGLKKEARINQPGIVNKNNWTWKLKDFKTFPAKVEKTKAWIQESNR